MNSEVKLSSLLWDFPFSVERIKYDRVLLSELSNSHFFLIYDL